ncbi:hypothetical protein [Methylophaga lonarensis]|uniref:hypothetical protein n=1 Tax=Methylophaga lonarensis TaxID=999151 RepID=UPI003D2E68AA
MTTKLSEKVKPTASDYLSASLEDIIERADKSHLQSEIPFVTALLSAKASRDQKASSNRMFWVAAVTTVIAALSFATTFSSRNNSDALDDSLSMIAESLMLLGHDINSLSDQINDTEKEIASTRLELQTLVSQFKIYGESQSEEHNNPLNSQASPAGTPLSGAH